MGEGQIMGNTKEQEKQGAERPLDYYLSFCVMTEGANPMGHSYLMVSQYDSSLGVDAKVEVVNALGFYSDYMPILGFKPIASGKIKSEDAAYIAGREGLYHKTYKVSFKDVDTLLSNIFKAKQLMDSHQHGAQKRVTSCQTCDQLPTFNLFKKKNCKQFALKELEKIGIDTSDLVSPFETPRMLHLAPFKIVKESVAGADAYYWASPICYEIKEPLRPSVQDIALQIQQQSSDALQISLERILKILSTRQKTLTSLRRISLPLNNAIIQLQAIQADVNTQMVYPARNTAPQLAKWLEQMQKSVDKCVLDLEKEGVEYNLINLLKDFIKEMLSTLHVRLKGQATIPLVHYSNSKDRWVFEQVEALIPAVRKRPLMVHS